VASAAPVCPPAGSAWHLPLANSPLAASLRWHALREG
jgi:hypothetical protein